MIRKHKNEGNRFLRFFYGLLFFQNSEREYIGIPSCCIEG